MLELFVSDKSLADASTRANEHTPNINGSAGWHYVNVPISEPSYDARSCPRSGCVVKKIGEYRRIPSDRRTKL